MITAHGKALADAYIDGLRNRPKRSYAIAYWSWVVDGRRGDQPPRSAGLSYMAAQAVRINLHKFDSGVAS